ncbi:hypothetical protein EBB07_20765 [Paenibacillaceae bacterium]|nr:hypothetical protein EBB07_20765 [Paenibacillaceae bacterium]
MKQRIVRGWKMSIKHFYIVILLFLYQLLCGFFLYRFVDSIVVPLLKRYPDTLQSQSTVHLFITEAQFQLMKTDILHPYLWTLGILFGIRMLMTPLINAGLFYSLRNATDEGGTRFFEGIRRAWKPVTLLYWITLLLIAAPGWWLLPRGFHILTQYGLSGLLSTNMLLWAGGWLIWIIVVHLLFLGMQFGAVAGVSLMSSLSQTLSRLAPLAAITVTMWAIGILIGLTVSTVSYIWAGLLALVLHQGYHLIRTLVKVWTTASQYETWQAGSDS